MKLTKEILEEIIREELESLDERLVRKIIYRDGKRKVVFRSDRDGYKSVKQDGRYKEVRMKPQEKRNRKIAQRKGSRKRRSGQRRAARKRARTNRRRN